MRHLSEYSYLQFYLKHGTILLSYGKRPGVFINKTLLYNMYKEKQKLIHCFHFELKLLYFGLNKDVVHSLAFLTVKLRRMLTTKMTYLNTVCLIFGEAKTHPV